MDRPSSTLWLRAFVVLVIVSNIFATVFGQLQTVSIDRAATQIGEHIAPSIERLAAARVEIRNLRLLLQDDLDEREDGRAGVDPAALDESQRAMDRALEAQDFREIVVAKTKLDHEVTLFRTEIRRNDLVSARAQLRDVAVAAADLHAAITKDIELDAARAENLALEIKRLRSRNMMQGFALDVASTAITIAAALLLLRLIRSREALAERHERLREERAAELEQFAGRVAHDILSPLGTVAFSLKLAAKERDDTRRAMLGDRGWAALERVKRLVNGLLDFARAGAKPDPEARVSVGETIADVVAELEPTAHSAGATLSVDRGEDCLAACHAGVLTSLVANLARNAIKYIGDAEEKRITIRWRRTTDGVRVDVEDTGPGLPIDLEARVFEPYARGQGTNRPGIGLGLATVKRLAEGHGGRVGVRSVPGEGCTFWFELPTAESDSAVSSGTIARANAAASA